MAGESRKYSIVRPLQDVRLRKWKPSKAQHFKKVIELLEIQLNKSMASQLSQGIKRVISRRVPTVVNLTVKSGFKNFQLTFSKAKGIKDLLFYEIQKSSTQNFAIVTTYVIPQISLTVPAVIEREQVYFRVRCVNSKFQAGPWSVTADAVARNWFSIGVFNTGDLGDIPLTANTGGEGSGEWYPTSPSNLNATLTDIAPANFNVWTDVETATYSPIAGSVCFIVHAGIIPTCINHFSPGNGVAKTITNCISVVFRVKINGVVQPSQMNVRSWGSQARSGAVPSVFTRSECVQVNTLVLPFKKYTGDEALTPYVVQAKVLTETCSSDVTSSVISARTYDDNVRIIVSYTTLLEIIPKQ